MGKRAVFYVMSGQPHLPYLLVSLVTLRRVYEGQIFIFAWDESHEICEIIGRQFDANVIKWSPSYRRKNAQFLCKQLVAMSLLRKSRRERYDKEGPEVPMVRTAMYLDADTMVMRDPNRLMDESDGMTFVATQFNDWKCSEGMPLGRISQLKKYDSIDRDLIDHCTQNPYPSVNGGVFVCNNDNCVADRWNYLTWKVRDLFIADEVVLHLIPVMYPDEVKVVHGWNTSPKYQDISDYQVAIWHFHGDSNVRLNKSKKGVDLWFPEYKRCWEENLCDVQNWAPDCGNKWLNTLIEEKEYQLVRTES